MPRPVPDSRLRRLLMQSIMWIILGATVGLAALVNHGKLRSLTSELGPPQTLDGFTIRLPEDWVAEDPDDSGTVLQVREPHADMFGRVITVTAKRPGWGDAFSALTDGSSSAGTTRSEPIRIAGVEGTMVVHRVPLMRSSRGSIYQISIVLTRPLDRGRFLTIRMAREYSRGAQKETDRDVELMKRIAAAVQVDSTAPAPTSQPQ